MAKNRAFVIAVGTGFFFAIFCLISVTLSQGNLTDPCTVGEFLYAFEHSGAKDFGILGFFLVVYVAYQAMAGRSNGVSSYERRPLMDGPPPPEFNTNGSIMHTPGTDATGHIRGDTRI